MEHAHQAQFGRRITAALGQDEPGRGVDKWAALERLTQAREAYGLSHRTLGVLRALMTFLPERVITTGYRSAIVFPSNATLSDRLNGMPESTLRRHLATLVHTGIVSRHDSANRKRFARRAGQGTRIAFGFDLSPLARMWEQISSAAATAEEEQEKVAALRAEVATLRQQVICLADETALTEEARRLLRRKCPPAELQAMVCTLQSECEGLRTREMSDTDTQNERHIDSEFKDYSVPADLEKPVQSHSPQALAAIVARCKEYKSFFPDAALTWPALSSVADRLCPMMAIDKSVYGDAVRKLGLAAAATAVLCILERLAEISNPGGYLRRLVQRGQEGQLCLKRLAQMVPPAENCQLTI